MDNGVFVFRAWHVLAGVFMLGALHMMFKANAPWTSASLKAEETRKAAEKEAKSK